MQIPTVTLNDKTKIPAIGLGTWKLTGSEGKQAITQAINLGYRHIDTAYHYNNHEVVGEAIASSNARRDEVFVTTKIWRDHLRKEDLDQQFKESLEQLGMDYVDLLLVHWPNQSVPIAETMSAMQDHKKAGRVKAIGVSNFTIELLEETSDIGVVPAVNQVEYHPTLVQTGLKEYCENNDITLIAYSPLGHTGRDLQLEPVKEIANRKSVSPATVIIRWLIQQDIVAIPKAQTKDHQKQNIKAATIKLSSNQMTAIDNCDHGNRLVAPDYGPFSGERKV
jgi:diketogulonate reductase-like aldo/keto reductase